MTDVIIILILLHFIDDNILLTITVQILDLDLRVIIVNKLAIKIITGTMNSIKRRIRSISESVLHDKIDKRRWAYRHSSLIPSTLRLVLLISLFFWFNVLVVSPSSHSYQIAAAKQIMNSTDHNLKSQTSLQLMTFDLPSKQTINENEDPMNH